ncbi:MAG: hypothetical protein C4297_07275 [Gemmataceae bacterium]
MASELVKTDKDVSMAMDGAVATAPPSAPEAAEYSAEHIQVLRNAEHVRQNPGMYIGDVGPRGLHHLVYELIHNSVDEAMAGYCHTIQVLLHVDGSVTVADDGRGIPVETHPTEGRSTLEVVMTQVGAGGKFAKDSYKVSAGLHGIGVKAVTALSEWARAEVRRDGYIWEQEYERGRPITDVRRIGVSQRTGTRITFRPDPEIFPQIRFDFETLESRLRELAFLNSGLTLEIVDEREQRRSSFRYDGGLKEFVAFLVASEEVKPLHEVVFMKKEVDGVQVEVALQYTTGEQDHLLSYVNNVHTPVGGTHVVGFRSALTRTIKQYAAREGLLKEGITLIGEDFLEGLIAVVSVRVPYPQFESQTKIRLNNPEVEGIVERVVNEQLGWFLEGHPQDARRIVERVALTAEAREAAARARKQLRERKNILSGNGLPGKLMDCTTKDRDHSELFLVEGDSAGGSADSGRDRIFQAVLPLRGKILNVEKRREKLLDNEEIVNIISAVGVDIGAEANADDRRYGKIILLTDADVDGSHIRTLLLTFFYRQMPCLIREGHVYLAQPPLYRVVHKKQVRYVQTAEEMDRELIERGLAGTSLRDAGSGRVFGSEQLRRLVEILTGLEQALQVLERRGLDLPTLRRHACGTALPQYRVYCGGEEKWFATAAELDAYRSAWAAAAGPEGPESAEVSLEVQELYEVRALMRGLERLAELGLSEQALLPPEAPAGRTPPPAFYLLREHQQEPLWHLRQLIPALRRWGEHGLTVTRFKGLGEMNPEELWATTMDPARRTLLRVELEDAVKADELFRILMGDKVEPRREFIERHALEVRNLDV